SAPESGRDLPRGGGAVEGAAFGGGGGWGGGGGGGRVYRLRRRRRGSSGRHASRFPFSASRSVDILPHGPDIGHHITDRDGLAFLHHDLDERAVRACDQLHHRFVGFDLGEGVPRLDLVALFLRPFDEAPFFHRGRK